MVILVNMQGEYTWRATMTPSLKYGVDFDSKVEILYAKMYIQALILNLFFS
jgi:hypothetical protein